MEDSKRVKEILIDAYVSLNLGDDLFIKILAERYLNSNFIVLTYYNYSNFLKLKNLRIIKYNIFQKFLDKLLRKLNLYLDYTKEKKINKVDCVIEIGGSIFIQNREYKNILKSREKKLKIKNYYILGANFGPYYTDDYLTNYKFFFEKCKDVCFREEKSYNLFKELNNIRMASDIVFCLKDLKKIEEKYILFSIIKPSFRKVLHDKDEDYYNKVIEITLELLKKGKKIKYMSFCKSEGDEEAIRKIKSKIPKEYLKGISEYYYNGNIEEALGVVRKSEIIVATRFHAMILGFIYGKKVLPIAYSEKTLNVLEDLEFKGEYIEFSNLKKMTAQIVLGSKKLEKIKLENAKQDSLKHFEKLDIYLNSDKNEK